MTGSGSSSQIDEVDDLGLIEGAKAGDRAAYAELYRRHAGFAIGVARRLGAGSEAEDIVAESFVQILRQMKKGGGPREAFRPYLSVTVRHGVCRHFGARSKVEVTDDQDRFDSPTDPDDRPDGFEKQVVQDAYATLPKRWQRVLWLVDVEGLKPREAASTLGMSANGVSALIYRARGALRDAYLDQHLKQDDASLPTACAKARAMMARAVRGTAPRRQQTQVRWHVNECAACSQVFEDLCVANRRVGAWLTPAASFTSLVGTGVWGGSILGIGAVTVGGVMPAVVAAVAVVVMGLVPSDTVHDDDPTRDGATSQALPEPEPEPERGEPRIHRERQVDEDRVAALVESSQTEMPTAPSVTVAPTVSGQGTPSSADLVAVLPSPPKKGDPAGTDGRGNPLIVDSVEDRGTTERTYSYTLQPMTVVGGDEPVRVVEEVSVHEVSRTTAYTTGPLDGADLEIRCGVPVVPGVRSVVTHTVYRVTQRGYVVNPDGTRTPFTDTEIFEDAEASAVTRTPPFRCADDDERSEAQSGGESDLPETVDEPDTRGGEDRDDTRGEAVEDPAGSSDARQDGEDATPPEGEEQDAAVHE